MPVSRGGKNRETKGIRDRTIILDTNIWSRLNDVDAGKKLRSVAHCSGLSVVAVPSVLYELASIPMADKRERALRLVTEMHWQRLMPEAYLESMEIVEAIRKHRPEWLHLDPDLREFKKLEYDWSRRNAPAKRRLRSEKKAGTWERFRFAPDLVHEVLEEHSGEDLNIARADAKASRQEVFEQGVTQPGPLRSVQATFVQPPRGWEGDPVAAWRAEALEAFTFYLFGRREGAYYDWISPFVNLGHVRRQSREWTRFWLYDVNDRELARQWMRWAFRHMARFRKVSPGTPCDVQLSAYLYDADFIASNDKLFVEFVDEASKYSPRRAAKGVLVENSPSVVERLFDLLPSLSNG